MQLITEFQYFPSIIFYHTLAEISNIIFDQYEYYAKMSFRNRCVIAGANGPITLSIPLESGRDQKKLTRDVKMADQIAWQKQHWKSITSAYNRAPWFEYYRDELEALYKKPVRFLMDWDLACFEWTVKKLGLSLQISTSEQYLANYPVGSLDQRNQLLPKNYLEPKPLVYTQVFQERNGFLPNLSILDLLFCEGKRAGALLRQKS